MHASALNKQVFELKKQNVDYSAMDPKDFPAFPSTTYNSTSRDYPIDWLN